MFVGMLRDVLATRGIPCLIKNEHLMGGVGEIPPIECWPELWVMEDRDVPVAQRVVDSLQPPTDSQGSAWVCDRCGERLEAQFSVCWRCGATRGPDAVR